MKEIQVDAQGISREVLFKSVALPMDVRGVWAVHTENFMKWMNNEQGVLLLAQSGVDMQKLHEMNGGTMEDLFKFLGDFSVTPIAVNAPTGESQLFLLKPLSN